MSDAQLSMFTIDSPSMKEFDPSRCYSKFINHKTAARVVKDYHYAHRVPNISYSIGMYVDEILAGVITYGMPSSVKISKAICGISYAGIVYELNRLYVHDWAGRNSESWLIGQSFKLMPSPAILVSYADTGQEHIGYIYQATNWLYTGLTDMCGNFSKIDIDGKERTSKSFYDELGTQARSVIIEHYPNAIFHPYTRKHRYVYLLGNKRERKQLRKALNYPVSDYPKVEYDQRL